MERVRFGWPGITLDPTTPGPVIPRPYALPVLPCPARLPDRDAGLERFFMPGREPFMLEPKSPVLYYLQRLRDEAHRFAIALPLKTRSVWSMTREQPRSIERDESGCKSASDVNGISKRGAECDRKPPGCRAAEAA